VSNPRLIYISGESGVGKTTLMTDLTAEWTPSPLPPERGVPARTVYLMARQPVAVQLGVHGRGGDVLPSTAIRDAESYVRSGRARGEAPLLLAEGARLGHVRFLRAAVDSGYEVTLLHLFSRELARARRVQHARATGQPEPDAAVVAARAAAARQLANTCEGYEGITVVPIDVAHLESNPDGDYAADIARQWATALGAVPAW
jgi:hypothetical protein